MVEFNKHIDQLIKLFQNDIEKLYGITLQFKPIEVYGNLAYFTSNSFPVQFIGDCNVYVRISELDYYTMYLELPCDLDVRDRYEYICEGQHYIVLYHKDGWFSLMGEIND